MVGMEAGSSWLVEGRRGEAEETSKPVQEIERSLLKHQEELEEQRQHSPLPANDLHSLAFILNDLFTCHAICGERRGVSICFVGRCGSHVMAGWPVVFRSS